MPLTGQEKKDWEFVSYRLKQQVTYWPDIVKRADRMANGRHYKAEARSYSDLWNLYIGEVKKLDEEEVVRGRKEQKKQIEPIKVRRAPGRFNDDGYLDFHNWLRARDQARKDLFWLAKYVLGKTRMEPSVHQDVCNQFCSKIFDGVFKDGYTLESFQDAMHKQNRVPLIWDVKKRNYIYNAEEFEHTDNAARIAIILDSRHFFKSTISGIDMLQWVLNCPDIQIMILTATKELAKEFLGEIKGYFYLALGAEPQALHILFPEYVTRGVKGTSVVELISPARLHTEVRHPTLFISSIESSLSGMRADLMKFDDVVSNDNSNTPGTRDSLRKQIEITKNLVSPWGKIDFIGTRYHTDDYYGSAFEAFKKNPDKANLKFYVRAAWYRKPGFESVKIQELTEEMVTLTFPQLFPFSRLQEMLLADEIVFRCQQLNEPAGDLLGNRIQFDESDIKARVITPSEALKKVGDTFTACDRGFSDKRYSDFSVIATGREFKKEDGTKALIVLEVEFGRWRDPELADKIAEYNAKWSPKSFYVEDGPRTDLLKRDVQEHYRRRVGHYASNMDWRMPDSQPDAKRNRIRGLATLLKNEQLYFANGPWINDLIFQFTKYTGERSSSTRKDDIPDAISLLTRYLRAPAIVLTPSEIEAKKRLDEVAYAQQALKEHYKRVFGDTWHKHVPSPEINIPKAPSPYDSVVSKLGLGKLFNRQ